MPGQFSSSPGLGARILRKAVGGVGGCREGRGGSRRMSKIMFGQSYYLRFDPKLWEAMQPYPPLGTLYAASYARARGHDVALFDAMLAESEDEWAKAIDE